MGDWRASIVVSIVVAFALAACERAPQPSLLLVTFDTTRYDRIGANGDPTARTPHVDALAARGLRFERAYASSGLTLPSHTTMMTGLEPLSHGVHNNGRFRVPANLTTLAEHLSEAGYATAAFVSAFVLDRFYGLDQGFDVYDDRTDRKTGRLDFSVPTRPGVEVTDAALEWLSARRGDEQGKQPFFLWAHYYDPHRPWQRHEEGGSFVDDYAGEIAYADAELGRLLAAAEQAAGGKLLVVFTADHGEGLGEHDEDTHGLLAYDSVLRVPLVLAGPGVPQGRETDVLAGHVDLLPTVLDVLGAASPADLPGRNLVNAAAASRRAGGAGTGEDDAVVRWFEATTAHHDYGWKAIEGVRTARWKYTALPDPVELYDVLVDPTELQERSEADPARTRAMDELFERFESRWRRTSLRIDEAEIDVDRMRQLAALGYVDSPTVTEDGGADPRRVVGSFSWIEEARGLASRGDYDKAIAVLETLRRSSAMRTLVLRSLAPVLAEAGRFDDAIAAYREYAGATPAPDAHLGLVRVLLRAGRTQEALEVLDESGLRGAEVVLLKARAMARLGRLDEARTALDEGLAGTRHAEARRRALAEILIDTAPREGSAVELRALHAQAPDDWHVASWSAYYEVVWGDGDREAALSLLEAAAASDGRDAVLQANLGWAAYRADRLDLAREALTTALEIDPVAQLERFRLARVEAAAGKPGLARALATTALTMAPGAPWAADARRFLGELPTGTEGDADPSSALFDPRKERP